MKTPKISVLMPIYKTNPDYLKEAIQSILNQTFTDFEFLILDDYPEDDREIIVRSFKDERIKYFKNEKNLGITPSRNKLIDLAQGEYLAVMDHDDISLPQRFEKQVAYLDTHPEVGVVGCWVDCFPVKKELHFPSTDLSIKILLTDVCSIVHPSSMIRKSVLKKYNLAYKQEFTPAEDYHLWISLMECTQFYNIPEVLFNYRSHDDNTSKNQKRGMDDATQRLHMFVQNKYPILYQNYLSSRTKIAYIKLFKIIPFLKIKKRFKKGTIYLFNWIPILSYKGGICSWPK